MVYIFIAEGFEEVEAVTIIDLLRRAKIEARSVSINETTDVLGAHDITMKADGAFSELTDSDFEDADMMVLPGGMGGVYNLDNFTPLAKKLKQFFAMGKIVAAICAAPVVLANKGILKGKRATIYTDMKEELEAGWKRDGSHKIDENGNTGAIFVDKNVVIDGNVITSRGPGTAIDFALALIGVLKSEAVAKTVEAALLR